MEKNINMDRDPKEVLYGYPPMWDSGYAKYWLRDIADRKNLVDYYYFKKVFGKEELKSITLLWVMNNLLIKLGKKLGGKLVKKKI